MVLTTVHDPAFALRPVALNSAWRVPAGRAWNNATGRRCPHPQVSTAPAGPTARASFTEADLDAVLARHNQVLDVPRDDLRQLLAQSEWQAQGRRLRSLRCEDVMTRDPLAVEFGTPLDDAGRLMRQRHIKALPVVDRNSHIVGIVIQADFLRLADLHLRDGLQARLHRSLRPTPASHAEKPEVVGQIMTRQVRVASADRLLAEWCRCSPPPGTTTSRSSARATGWSA